MTASTLLRYSVFFFVFVVASSCHSPELDATGEIYLDVDALQANDINGPDPIQKLGRVLFYDRQMSLNNTIACASCHKQQYGFADNQKFSRGFESRLTSRNSMPIQNVINLTFFEGDLTNGSTGSSFNNNGAIHFFWDGREQNLQNLILQPVGNHIEMGITDIDALTQKLSALPYYTQLFSDAYGDPAITAERISQSVSTFIQSIGANNTKFDRHKFGQFVADPVTGEIKQQPTESFTSLELEGEMLFEEKYDCNSCHQVQSPNGYIAVGTFANIGLDQTYSDQGLQMTTGNPEDAGKFKIPSLRNVAFTAPYMHDGRFESLEEVIDHYSEGIADHPNLDDKLKDAAGNARSMNISAHEKEALIAFLRTLSDESVITSQRHSNPFKLR